MTGTRIWTVVATRMLPAVLLLACSVAFPYEGGKPAPEAAEDQRAAGATAAGATTVGAPEAGDMEAGATAESDRGRRRKGKSEKLNFATYRVRSGGLTVLVDAWLAANHRDDPFFPLPIAIGLEGEGGPVAFSPESFTLVDAEGGGHAAASFERLSNDYSKRNYDASLMRGRPMTLGSLSTKGRRIESSFYPPAGKTLRTPEIELSSYTWFRDVVYFPMPPAGLSGGMILRVKGRGMEGPLEVRFEVPASGEAQSEEKASADVGR